MAKKLIYILLIFCCAAQLKAQVLVQQLPDQNLCAIDVDFMQKGYKLAFSNMTSEDYLFKGREEEWKKSWINLMHDLNGYMQKNGLKLNAKNTCFNRVYFTKEGKIAAYLYHLEGLTAVQEQKFNELIFQFLFEQKLNITSNQNYWQYGTLKFE